MPRTSRWIAAALSLVVAGSLSACVTEPEPPPRTSSATPTPDSVFDSDADALAAAIEAYEAYRRISFAVTSGSDREPSDIREVATSGYAEELESSLREFQESGNRTTGESSFDSATLMNRGVEPDGSYRVTIYMCRDVSGVRVVDSQGIDVTNEDRDERLPLVISFASTVDDRAKLLIDGSEVWSGDDFC